MKQKIKHILTIFSLTVLVTSCSEQTPAGFWTDFHKDAIVTKNSNQGPWGGHREMHWKSSTPNTFTDKELIEFGNKNDWKFLDSVSVSTDTLSKNSFSGTKESFSRLKNDSYSLYLLFENILPNLKSNKNKILVFKTNWLTVEPGNTDETYENGFAVLNSDGTELKIYHLWGE